MSRLPPLPKSPFLEEAERSDSAQDATRVGSRPSATGAEARLVGYLTVIVGEHPGKMHELAGPSLILGRGAECDVRLDSDGVSRKHAWIRRDGSQYYIEDLKSTNGTWLDGISINASVLTSGVRIRVGTDVVVRFNVLDDAEAALQQRLYESGTEDTLTGVYNRRYFDQALATEVAQSSRLSLSLALILLQVDDMKGVNDYYTQAGGDAMLRELAQLIRTNAGDHVIARTGQDHFGIIVRGSTRDEACGLAEKLRAAVERLEVLWQSGDFSICIQSVTARISVTTSEDISAPASGEAMVVKATERLLQAKEQGGNTVVSS